jgi:selenocysteine-specific elongation factor
LFKIGSFGYLHQEPVQKGEDRMAERLGKFHEDNPMREGMGILDLRSDLGLDKTAFDFMLGHMVEHGRVRRLGSIVSLAGFEVELSPGDLDALSKLEAVFKEGWFNPPGIAEASDGAGLPVGRGMGFITLLEDREVLVAVSEDIRFHREAFEAAEKKLVEYLKEHGEIGAVSFRDLIGTSRKFAYPMLDYFDVRGVTVRKGNLRYLKARQ